MILRSDEMVTQRKSLIDRWQSPFDAACLPRSVVSSEISQTESFRRPHTGCNLKTNGCRLRANKGSEDRIDKDNASHAVQRAEVSYVYTNKTWQVLAVCTGPHNTIIVSTRQVYDPMLWQTIYLTILAFAIM